MAHEATPNEKSTAFMGRMSIVDVGLGVLYFFTSHMVIRTMYYIGVDRSSFELSVFFLTVITAAILAHIFSHPLLRFRLFVESGMGVPVVSVVAASGAALALISTLPVIDVLLFYLSGVLLGAACGWIVVIWTSTMHIDRPDSNSFYLHPSLLIAVITYFFFRFVSVLSSDITQGFLLALPLISIACIVQGYRKNLKKNALGSSEDMQALQVLVVVAAAFAIGGSIAIYLSGHTDSQLNSGLNYMVLFEVLAISLIVFFCWIMNRFSQKKELVGARSTAVFSFCVIYPGLFFIGLMMGSVGIPDNSPSALWESNIWVLLIAIFAYDIRESLYVVKGLAVGIMFEVMCIGQIVAHISALNSIPYALPLSIGLTILYFTSICVQLFRTTLSRGKMGSEKTALQKVAKRPSLKSTSTSTAKQKHLRKVSFDSADDLPVPSPSVSPDTSPSKEMSSRMDQEVLNEEPSELLVYCGEIARDYKLTPREAEILGLIAMGRSAKYIAEELVISHNTTRTHIKHVYEKLNIHSKQELIDLVVFGSGLM